MPHDSRGRYYEDDSTEATLGVASAALTATASIEAQTPGRGVLFIDYIVTAMAGTSPTLSVVIETSPDDGATWYESRALAQITGVSTARVMVPCAGDRVRIRQTVGGTSPSFTRSVTTRFQGSS